MTYDVAVIGAGPAGLMAAKTAAEQGLKVVLLEKREDVSKITRACCQQFILDEGYENEFIRLEPGRVIFTRNGFEVTYDGPTSAITDQVFTSPRGRTVRFAHPDRRPIAMKFDKGILLKGLWERCANLGVEIRNHSIAYNAADAAQGIEVNVAGKGTKSSLRGRKVIVADGVNSRIADALGMNGGRTYLVSAVGLAYTLENVKGFDPHAWTFYMGQAYHSMASVISYPTLLGAGVANFLCMGNKHAPPERIFHDVTTRSPIAFMFEKAKVIGISGCGVKAYTSMAVPYKGNALAIGDAAAYVEVETQGALMCGYRAGKATAKELSGEKGFEEYASWWQRSFEFNGPEALQVAQGYALVPTYTDDELDYLFSLTEDVVLEGTISQYRSPKLLWNSIMSHQERIERERPELSEKIKKNREMTLKGTF